MDEKTEKLTGLSQVEFEAQRRAVALSILKKTDEFIAWDLRFNQHLSNLAEELVKQLKANPRIIESNTGIRDLLRELQAEKGQGSGITGGDILGGDAWDDIWGIIKDMLTGEKDFIKDIIIKILGI